MASVRVQLNRAAYSEMQVALADGLGAVGDAIIAAAVPNVPDAPPLRRGLVKKGAWVTLVNGRKVGGKGSVPRQIGRTLGVVLAVGYPFPARFLERGTVKIKARPFLLPAAEAVMPRLGQMVVAGLQKLK